MSMINFNFNKFLLQLDTSQAKKDKIIIKKSRKSKKKDLVYLVLEIKILSILIISLIKLMLSKQLKLKNLKKSINNVVFNASNYFKKMLGLILNHLHFVQINV